MLLQRRGCCWWMLVMMTITAMTMWTEAQKIETDGLGEDKYNQKDDENDHVKDQTKSTPPLKYVVTEEVFLDITISNTTESELSHSGRVTIACFGEITPITCLNFVALAKGYRKGSKWLSYKGTPVHRVVRDFVVQMGDVSGKKGRGGKCIFGDKFEDENFELSHRGAGWVSMANHGRNTNGSQFFVLLQPARWLDGRHVVFGKVINGMDLIRKIGETTTRVTGRPRASIDIVDSGAVGITKKYELSAAEADSQEDLAK
ncbi:hypothetical protein ACOMHN_012268 [Nucella lapillus]